MNRNPNKAVIARSIEGGEGDVAISEE